MRADHLLLNNIRALLTARGQKQRDLAFWMQRHETWLSKILKADRGVRMKDLDRIADFFGLTVHQLFAPGTSAYAERRRGDRRSGRDRRSGTDRRGSHLQHETPLRRRRVGRRI